MCQRRAHKWGYAGLDITLEAPSEVSGRCCVFSVCLVWNKKEKLQGDAQPGVVCLVFLQKKYKETPLHGGIFGKKTSFKKLVDSFARFPHLPGPPPLSPLSCIERPALPGHRKADKRPAVKKTTQKTAKIDLYTLLSRAVMATISPKRKTRRP